MATDRRYAGSPTKKMMMLALGQLTGEHGATAGEVKKLLEGRVEPGAVDWVLRRSTDFGFLEKHGERYVNSALAREMRRRGRRRRSRSKGRRRSKSRGRRRKSPRRRRRH